MRDRYMDIYLSRTLGIPRNTLRQDLQKGLNSPRLLMERWNAPDFSISITDIASESRGLECQPFILKASLIQVTHFISIA